jgi:ATP dependent DNA ligase domain
VHEYEGVVDKFYGRHCAGVHHHLVRINPLTSRGNPRIRRGARPYSETSGDQSGGGAGNQSSLKHLSSPVLMPGNMPDHAFGRCDGDHKTVDFRRARERPRDGPQVAITGAQLYSARMLQRTLPAGFIAPCLPSKTDKLPSGSQWLHDIKHDGFRVIARKNGTQVRLYSRPGNDLTYRFPLIVETLSRLRSRSCIIDGEAVACDDNGVTSFNRVRYRHHDESIFLYTFDLSELNGDDLRRDPLEGRKATLGGHDNPLKSL